MGTAGDRNCPGKLAIQPAAIRKLTASKKNICLAPMNAAIAPANPGPRTPNNCSVELESAIAWG